jgi:hypothetical protein
MVKMSETKKARVPPTANHQEPQADISVLNPTNKILSPVIDGETGRFLSPMDEAVRRIQKSLAWYQNGDESIEIARDAGLVSNIHDYRYGIIIGLRMALVHLQATQEDDIRLQAIEAAALEEVGNHAGH